MLDELIAYLKTTAGDRLIRVEGHADNMEIGPSLKSRYQTNWDLSKARAGGVLRYLIEKGGIDSAKLSSVGYGDTKPLTSNATEVGRQKNRRVDIVLYSPESAREQSEPAAKPVETGDNGVNLSHLSSAESGAPISTGEETIPPAPTDSSMADPSSVPAEPAPDGDSGTSWQGQFRSEPRCSGRSSTVNSSSIVRRVDVESSTLPGSPLRNFPFLLSRLFPLFQCCYNAA